MIGLYVGHYGCLLLSIVATNAGVIDQGALEVVVFGIVLVQHRRRDVWYIATSIRLAGDVNFVVLDAKGVLEVLEEVDEVLSDLRLGGCCLGTLGEARAYGLLNPASCEFRCHSTWRVRTRACWSG